MAYQRIAGRAVHGVYDGDIYWCVMGINSKTTFEPPKTRVYTITGSVSALIDPEKDPLTHSARKEKELVERDLNRARGGIDLAERTGRMNRGQAAQNEQNFQAQKEKEKHEKAMQAAMKQAQKDLEQRMEELAQELDKVNKVLGAFDKLEDLIKNGKFDKDNAAHLLLLQQTGVTLEEVEGPGALEKTKEKRQPFEERRKEIIKEAEGLVKEAADNNYSSNAIAEFAQKIAQTDREISYEVAANQKAPEILKTIAANTRTEDHKQQELSFSSFASGLGDLGEGIKPNDDNLNLGTAFAKAAAPIPGVPSELKKVASLDTKLTFG
ncbi:MAG: hypothetical protein KC643_12855 [Nitrospira sp.]|nr:hypothetical protein [Nitrospira sp.]MCA9498858.1 hypothetical protein [Nitrospira sp.]